jgi:UPF0716 protein FxsA
MLLRIIGLLLLIPLFDIVLLVFVATQLGPVPTIVLVVLTALIGLLLVRAEGRHTARKIQTKLARGQLPTDELLDGGLLIAAGALLLTPGLVTDLVGLLLVIPVTRYPVRVATERFVIRPYVNAKTDGLYTGTAYTGGFPGPDSASTSGSEGDSDTYDVDQDDYNVED